MHIAIRTDSSLQIGTGHVMRCLTLADVLSDRGAQITFICRPQAGDLLDMICQRGHAVKTLGPVDGLLTAPTEPTYAQWLGTDWASDSEQTKQVLEHQVVEWLIVDHYALDYRWERALRPHTQRIMVIDDLANRQHECDLLLDQNLGRHTRDYIGLFSRNSQTLIGPEYALLRPEFAVWRDKSLLRRVMPHLKKLLITMGGVDQVNATSQVMDALTSCDLPFDLSIIVVMGLRAPWIGEVQARVATMPRPTKVLVGVNNMAQLMAESDLCISAAGGTSWECCCLGLPAIQLVLADNQKEINVALDTSGSVITVNLEKLQAELPGLIKKMNSPDVLGALSISAAAVCDGKGAIKAVQCMDKLINENHNSLQ